MSRPLETERLLLRPWTLSETDRSFHHFIHSDPSVRKFYATRLTREQSDERLEKMVGEQTPDSLHWMAVCLKGEERPIGFSGLARIGYDTAHTRAGEVEIGWLYDPAHWGKGYATEAGRALLAHGLHELGLQRIVAFAVETNLASIAVMERIGMVRETGREFDHPMVFDSHPHLRRHVLYSAEPAPARM